MVKLDMVVNLMEIAAAPSSGAADTLTVVNWYRGGAYQVDAFVTVDGRAAPGPPCRWPRA